MKKYFSVCLIFCAWSTVTHGQGVLDQYSSTGAPSIEGGANVSQNPSQSFTPTLTTIDFVRLYVEYAIGGTPTMSINLLANSPNGQLVASTTPLTINNSTGPVEFSFANPVSLTPGSIYVLQPVLQSSGDAHLNLFGQNVYSGGTLYYSGTAYPYDLWFQEGTVVPEPSVSALLLVGVGFLLYARHLHRRLWTRHSNKIRQ
jgi:hypothetical protein